VAPVSLNAVARDCARAGGPDLSALVVLADSGPPGWLDGEVMDPHDPRARTAWCAELERIRTFNWQDDWALQNGR
jgi:hypothetical protein